MKPNGKKKCTIITHQGYGDLFSCNSICNYYSSKYDECLLFAYDDKRKKLLNAMYHDNDRIRIEIPKITNTYDGINSCITCHTKGNDLVCPRTNNTKCIYIDYSKYEEYENIKIGSFKDFEKWSNHLKISKSFSHAFYSFENLDENIRIKNFKISDCNQIKMEQFIGKEYICIHHDVNRNRTLKIGGDKIIYNLNSSSEIMIDQIYMLENSTEIHMIDSSYSVIIYYLSFTNKTIEKIPKYLHSYSVSGRDLMIYSNPIPNNWFFV